MSKPDIVKEWLTIAFEDYDTALYLFENKRPKPLEIICYHCQQSVEKSLKAFLCLSGIEVPKTHEVGLLCHRCAEFNNDFADFFEDCEELEIYATGTRYPSRIELDSTNATRALEQTRDIYDFVVTQVKLSKRD